VTGVNKKLQALGYRQMTLVAELGDRHAADQFHYEVGTARGRLPAIQNPRNVRMLHQGQRLSLGLEAGDNPARVHSRLNDFECDLAVDWMLLFRQKTTPKPPSPIGSRSL